MTNKIFKGLGIILSGVCVLLILGFVFADDIVKNRLEATINRLPENVIFNFEDLSVDVFEGTMAVKKPELIINEEAQKTMAFHFKLQDFILKDISFWDYLIHNNIHLTHLILDDPEFTYVKNDSGSTNTVAKKKKGLKDFNKLVKIDSFKLNNARITIFEGTQDSVFFDTKDVNLAFNDIKFDKNTAESTIPFEYSDYEITTKGLEFQPGAFERITLNSLKLTRNHWEVNDIKLNTIYSKTELSNKINQERDHFTVSVDRISLNAPEFGLENRWFYFKTDLVEVETPSLTIFRDKLVKDDPTVKQLYSAMLRKLPFYLSLNKVQIKNGFIKYEEKVKPGKHFGEVTFEDFNAQILNLSNTYKSPVKTELDINAVFMKTAPLHAYWTFDVNNEQDEFSFQTTIENLPAYRLNLFTENNLNVRLKGRFDKINVLINGNVDDSRFTFEAKYHDVKVTILNKRHVEDKLLTGLANIFIHKNSKHKNNNYVEHHNRVERDKTKSVFNFLWLNVKEGLKESFINGKK